MQRTSNKPNLTKQRRDDGPNSEATPGSPFTKPSLWARRRARRAATKRAKAQRTGARVRRPR